MKKKTFLFLIVILSVSLKAENYKNEVLRNKIERLQNNHIIENQYAVYCVSSLREVYLKSGFNPYWNDKQEINNFTKIIEKSHQEGLIPEDYHLSEIRALLKSSSLNDKINLEIFLSDAFLLYSTHLLAGKTNPATLDAEWHVLTIDRDPVKHFYRIGNEDIHKILNDVIPTSKIYADLKSKLAEYRILEKSIPFEKIESGVNLKLGAIDSRIPSIRRVLALFGDYEVSTQGVNNEVYDQTLQLAVIRFQKRHGLNSEGVIGLQTLEAINTRLTNRIQTIVVNLERLRWLPNELPNYYIHVNISNFELEAIDSNKIIASHKVIVGKPFRKTPVFSSRMEYIVFNPTWTIPPTILKNDILPATRKNASYLEEKKIRVYDKQETLIDIHKVDWNKSEVLNYTYRQEPGKQNALGVVKFMFPNKYAVYIHDTPSKELFEKTERAFSSGCIRVQNPLKLATTLLVNQPGFDSQNIHRIVESGKTQTVILKNKPQVFFIYLTSWVDNEDQLQFRKDIYERDQVLYNALQEKPVFDVR